MGCEEKTKAENFARKLWNLHRNFLMLNIKLT